MDKMNKRQIRRGGRGARGARGGAKRFMRPEKGKFKPKNTSLPSLRAPNWNNLDLEPFQKNFYREHPNVMNRLRQDVERFRNKHEITVQGLALNPIESFDEVFMPDYVAREIRNQGYNRPTPIQSQTWPIAFSGYNLVGIAQTGSGKTLAYILPAIIHINNQPNIKPGDGPIAVVLAPTRELAVQIEQVAIDFGSSTHIRTVCTVGGIDKKPQEAALLKGCEIVVATPGRLLDFLSANVTNMKRCTYLVLDEADRMLDMGFEAQIRDIISQIRPDKQILMWSATWPLEIRRLAEDFLGNYIQVNIGSLELSANHNIKQFIHICQENEKSSKLQLLLRQIYQANNPGKILIFVSKKKRADMISKYINNFGVACESLHGDKAQSQRTKILDDFRSGRSNIIVATDVAARGLDVDGIMYVINLDFPKLIEDYVHRIGRCGRCDRMGISYAFFTTNDAKQAKDLIAILNEANQPVDAKLQEMAFNPQKPEKIDKKQRRINENSGFNVSVPEKRRHDGRNANFSAAGPSNANAEDAYVGEPDIKRERIVEPEQSGRGVMFNHNNDRDFMEERSMNRGYMDIPATAYNSNQLDNHSIGLRPFEARNSDRFQSDDRATNRDLVEERPTATRHLMERRREDFERSITGRAPQNPNDGMDEYRMRGEGPNVRQRLLSPHFERGEPTIGLGRGDPAIGLGRGDPAIGLGRGDPAIGLGRSDPAIGLGRGDPAIGLGRGDPAIGLGRGDPAIGLNRMRNLRESSFDRQENDFGRRGNDFHRQVDDLDRRRTDFDCRQTDFDRHRTDFVRQENDSDLRVTDFDRRENDIDRRENDIGRRGSNFGRRENDFDRLSDINHFHDRSNDVRDSFGGGQRHIRDGLLDSMDRDVDRSGPIFDSSVSDRRNFERELMDNRDIRALNFEDVLQIRTYDALSERRSVLQEFRPISPNSMLDRSDISADRFLNRPRGDDPFDSLHQFGSRRGNSRDRTDDSGFNMSDRRNDFIDEIDRNQPTSSRWNNDFAARDPQDRRDFNNDSRRTINFSLDGETNFNFTRNNDYGNDDGFRNRNRRDFKRPNQDDRFNCFN